MESYPAECDDCMSWDVKIDKADKVFSQWVRLNDGKCMRCGSPVRLNAKGLPVSHQASHFQGRRKENTRHDPENVRCLCGGCHQYLGSHPGEHYEFQVSLMGQEKVDEIILKSSMYCKKDRELQYIYWKNRLREDFGV